MKKHIIAAAVAATLCISCTTEHPKLNHNAETEILYNNLKRLVDEDKTLFGQANPTTISYLGRLSNGDITHSDCKDITGSHPAFYESDFMWYRDTTFARIDIKAMDEAQQRGSLTGYCWHIGGMRTQRFYSTEKDGSMSADSTLVRDIVSNPNRDTNESLNWLLTQLDSLVIPVLSSSAHPIIFRPWHEMNGGWFWWGSRNCTPSEYIQLYRITVDYIRNCGVRNVLFAWSPDKRFATEYYPGDEYVDILGMDVYEPGIMDYSAWDIIIPELTRMIQYADSTDKVAALTETGCRKDDDGNFRYPDTYPDFWSNNILEKILLNKPTSRLAWVMSWYGADWSGQQTTEAYIPYIGCTRPNADAAADDFRKFIFSDKVIAENEIDQLYE